MIDSNTCDTCQYHMEVSFMWHYVKQLSMFLVSLCPVDMLVWIKVERVLNCFHAVCFSRCKSLSLPDTIVSGGVSGLEAELRVWRLGDMSHSKVQEEQLAQSNCVISWSLLASVISSETISLWWSETSLVWPLPVHVIVYALAFKAPGLLSGH